MPFWTRIWNTLRPRREPRSFDLDEGVVQSLQDLARREQLPPGQLASTLLQQALEERRAAEFRQRRWNELTQREQQVVALICLDYNSKQIASRLNISPETVKTHAHNALFKLGARNRTELRRFGLYLVKWIRLMS